jgi:hypothetical protein
MCNCDARNVCQNCINEAFEAASKVSADYGHAYPLDADLDAQIRDAELLAQIDYSDDQGRYDLSQAEEDAYCELDLLGD